MKLLVIGASYAGLSLVRQLKNVDSLEVVIVDPKQYFEFQFTAPRWLQCEDDIDKLVLPRSRLDVQNHISAAVVELHSKHAVLSNGERVDFDCCAVCCGSRYSNTFCKGAADVSYEGRVEELKTVSRRVRGAKSVLVIGGGATGMEMAAEAKEAGVGRVVLVHSKPYLGFSEKQGAVPKARLGKLGVEVHLGTRAEPQGRSSSTYEISGRSESFDEVFVCTGPTMQTAFAAPLGPDARLPSGAFNVNESFQVSGRPHIFAVGDCIDVDSCKLAYLAVKQGALCAKNLQTYIAAPTAKLKRWTPDNGHKVSLLALGKRNALLCYGDTICFPYLPGCTPDFKVPSVAFSLKIKL